MLAVAIQRGMIVVGALLASAAVLQTGLAQMVNRTDPLLAARIAHGDARIAVDAARATIARGADPSDPGVQTLVDAALARDATLPTAIELRAVALGMKGDAGREARLFELSSAISRRSLPTRLWLIQRSVDRGDVGGALQDFDVALRTSAAAPPLFFPVLAGATTDPTLIGPIAKMLDRPSDWRLMFLNYAVRQNATGIAGVVLRMHDRGFVRANGVDRTLLARFVELRSFALAGQIRDAFSGGRRPSLVADGEFAETSQGYPFGWQFTDRGDVGAERGVVGGRPVLSYRAEPGRGGQVASQLLLLAPGKYRLTTTAASTAGDAPPYWTLTCGERGGAALARLDVLAQDRGTNGVDFTVPSDCAGQWLTLTVQPGGAAGGQTGAIGAVGINRL